MKQRRKAAKRATSARPSGGVSPEFAAAVAAFVSAAGRAKGPTLAKLRSTLKGSGMTWSGEGELLFPQDRTALLIEIDELIDSHGAQADALALVSPRKS